MENKVLKPKIRFKGFADTWEQRKVGDYGEIVTGNTPSTQKEEYYSEDGILWVTPTDISSNIIKDTAKKLSNEGIKVARKLPKNSILVTCIASIGKNTMLENTGSCNQQINAVIPNTKNYNPYFLLTESELWSIEMKKSAAAGTMQIVNKTEFSEVNTYAPKIEEQVKLGHMFKQIDNLITLHQSKYDKLVNVKKALLEKMFPKDGKNVPEIRFKGFTDTWEQRKLGEYGDFTYGHSAPKWSVTPDATTPCVRYGELYTKFGVKIDKVFSHTNMPHNKLVFSKGTEVLIPRVGEDPYDYNHCTWLSIPNVAIGEMISIYYTKQSPLFTAIMYNATLKNEFAIRVEGGSVTNLYYEKLKDIDVAFPKIEEQEKISQFFYKIDNLITLHQHKLEKLKNMKKSLLNKMFI